MRTQKVAARRMQSPDTRSREEQGGARGLDLPIQKESEAPRTLAEKTHATPGRKPKMSAAPPSKKMA